MTLYTPTILKKDDSLNKQNVLLDSQQRKLKGF